MARMRIWAFSIVLGGWGLSLPAMAQTIVPAADGTATLVMPNGNTFNITGGQLSGDGRNLFHSFQDFGLSAQQIANFIANPQIQNILGRVVGGNPSVINGLLQVSGANANLFLMNPSGIVFGPNAALNVPASFAATTATGINFGAGQFNAFGPNNYSALTGTPQGFIFQGLQSGGIINAGNLSVNAGEGISLTGGTVVNTGSINAPGGEITLTAVPGSGLVRISQKGQVLSLEVPLPQDSQGNPLPFQPADLPALLTGSGLDAGLTVTPNGAVALAQSGTQIPTQPGTAIVSGSVNVSSPTSAGGTAQITGAQVGLVGAQVQADGLLGGGTLKVGGDYRGQGSLPTAQNTFISADSNLSADAWGQGDGGQITVWADGNTQFQGSISAKGGPQGGDGGLAEVSGKENLAFQGQANLTAPRGELGTLLLDPENITIVSGSVGLNDGQLPVILFGQDPGADYTISESALEALAGTTNIQLEAANNITVNPLLDGILSFQSGNGTITFSANADNLGGGDFTMGAGDTLSAPGRSLTIRGVNIGVGSINTSNLQIPGTPGGNIALLGTGNIQSTGLLNGGGGAVTLSGANITLPLGASVLTGDSTQAGAATLTATGATQIEGTILTYGNSLNISSGSLTTTANAWLDSSNSANPNLPGGPITLNNTGDAQIGGFVFTAGAPLTVSGNNINIADTALVLTDSLDPNAVGGALTLQGTGNVQIGSPSVSGSFGGLVETGGGAVTASGANVTLNIPLDTSNPNSALPGGAVTLAATGTNQINSSVTTGGGNFTASGANIQIPASSTINVLNGTGGVKGGNVVFQSSGDLQLNQSFITNGGSFSATAANLTLPEVNTSTGADGLDGGAITLNATGNIQTGNLLSYTTANRSNGEASRGGDITLNAGGSINTTAGTGVEVAQTSSQTLFVPVVTSGSETGNGGNINFTAGGDITSAFLGSGSLANGTAGTVTLTSQNGGINATQTVTLDGDSQILGAIISASNQGQGGNVTLTAPGNIQTGSIITGNIDGVQPVGSVTITSSSGSINTAIGANISPLSQALLAELGVDAQYLAEASQIAAGLGIITVSKNVSGGAVALNAQGDITTTNIITGSLNGAGGDINLTSAAGSIDASSGVLLENVTASFLQSLGASENLARLGAYLSDNQIGGLITLSVYGNGGDINLSAPGGIITNYLVANSYVGQGGNITLNSANGSIKIGGLITSVNPLTFNVASDGLTLDAWNAIGSLLSQGTLTTAGANGGNITLTASEDIEAVTVNAQATTGTGGTVEIRAGENVRVTGTFVDQNGVIASISTAGGAGGGPITIQAGNVPFVVGNPSLNGTAGAITTGETTISAEDFNFTTQRGDIALILRPPCGDACVEIEDAFNPRYTPPFNLALLPQNLPVKTLEQADDILAQIEAQTGKKPALIYVNFVYPQLKAPVLANAQFQQLESARVSEFQTVLTPSLPNAAPTLQIPAQGDYQLELVVVTRGEDPLRIPVPTATQRQVVTAANRFRAIVSKQQNDYQTYGAQLYQWLMAPLEPVFTARGIDSALFFLPNGLRTLPLAALYDEKEGKFAVEKPFAIGTAPSLNLVDYRYRNLNAAPVLAFGATEFASDQQQTPLPGVGVELPLIQSIKGGQYFLNPEFNLPNVESQRRQNPLPIVHLATHADFLADSPQSSYIQLYNQKLELPQWDRLDLNLPATDLLVISACNSAVGNWAVELGFGGMAVQAGVKTALASLWPVGDIGTVGLMDSFYRNLKEVPIKSEALQLAQRALLRGQYRWVNDRLITPQGEIEFKGAEIPQIQSLDLTHPYFWASFLMIGSPW